MKPRTTSFDHQLQRMKDDWDRRAHENARYYVQTAKDDWDDAEFFASGDQTVREEILNDMVNICQGKTPKSMRVLEIGCGAARVTRALAAIFEEIHAVDISPEMVRQARESLKLVSNVVIYENNGMDLTVIPELEFDFAFSSLVFQHIPHREVIESYVREVHRLLRSGALFKFQVHGDLAATAPLDQTWVGIPFSDEDMTAMAHRCGFERRYCYGAGTQYFWNWFFKRPE